MAPQLHTMVPCRSRASFGLCLSGRSIDPAMNVAIRMRDARVGCVELTTLAERIADNSDAGESR